MDTTTPAQDPVVVLSPTLDAATVDATRWLITELRADGHSVEDVAAAAAEHLTDAVTEYAKLADPNYDPTDAELEAAWNGPDAPAAHRAAWRLHQELHDRSAS